MSRVHRPFIALAATTLALALAACGPSATPPAAQQAAAQETTAPDAAYCDAVHDLDEATTAGARAIRKGDRDAIRTSVESAVAASTSAHDAAPDDLSASWDPVVKMFTAYEKAVKRLDYRLNNAMADRTIERLPTSDGALHTIWADAETRCGLEGK